VIDRSNGRLASIESLTDGDGDGNHMLAMI